MKNSDYDIGIVGAGPAGYCAAIRAAQLGMKVVCVDKRGLQGGTCLYEGCIPAKVLLDVAHKFEQLHHMKDIGISLKNQSINLAQVMKHKDKVVQELSSGIQSLFRHYKIDFFHDEATFQDSKTLFLKGAQKKISAERILIATGSKPAVFPNLPFDDDKILSSTKALELSNIPKSLVIIGGGVIALELGSVWNRFGSEVTIVEAQEQILPSFDTDVVQVLHKKLEDSGVTFYTNTKVLNVTQKRSVVVAIDYEGKVKDLKADKVVVAIGRKPNTEGLGLKNVGINVDNNGRIVVDTNGQTSVPDIYAVGDVTIGPMLAHKAMDEATSLVERLHGHKVWINVHTIPDVVYTYPEIASVGKNEKQLIREGIEFKVGKFPLKANGRARVTCEKDGFVKILIDSKTDRILGASIVSSDAGTMISELVLAMEMGASAEDVARTCHPHPTLNESIQEAAWGAFDKPLHLV